MNVSGPLVAIYGGTFDPFHNGHLGSALELLARLPLSEVRLLPAARPPLRDVPAATDLQRLAMVSAATAAYPGLIVDARELSRSGESYTVDSVREMRNAWPDTRLVLVLGTDAFNSITRWFRWRELLSMCAVLVIQRPGYVFGLPDALAHKTAIVLDGDEQRLQDCAAGELYRITLQQWPLSATDVRSRLGSGDDVTGMLPAAVYQYIQNHDLYRSTGAV